MARHAIHSGKAFGDHAHAKMGFSGSIKAIMVITVGMVMTRMVMTFIYDFKTLRRKSRFEFLLDHRLFVNRNGHLGQFSPYRRCASYRRRFGGIWWGKSAQDSQLAANFALNERPNWSGRNVNSCLVTLNPHNSIR